MKKNIVLCLTIILACFSLHFLINTIDFYNAEQILLEDIYGTTSPDTFIIAEDGSYIINPETASYEIGRDLSYELLGRMRIGLRENKNMLLVFIFLTIISFIIWRQTK